MHGDFGLFHSPFCKAVGETVLGNNIVLLLGNAKYFTNLYIILGMSLGLRVLQLYGYSNFILEKKQQG